MESVLSFNQGFMVCLGAQLLALSALKITRSDMRDKLLGTFIILLGLAYLRPIIIYFFNDYQWFTGIFMARIEVFFPPLLYLYIKLSDDTVSLSKHLVFPFIYFVLNLYIKWVFPYELSNGSLLPMMLNVLLFLYFAFYFYIGIRLINNKLSQSLKEKAFHKFKMLFIIINVYELLNLFINNVFYYNSSFDTFKGSFIMSFIESSFLRYVLFSMAFVQVLYLIFYVFTDISFFKAYYLGKNIEELKRTEFNYEDLGSKLSAIFKTEELFIDPNLKIQDVASKLGVSQKVMRAYFNESLKESFVDYVNRYRVNKFKELLMSSDNSIYSIDAIAIDAGFKSKSTLYRVFRKHEGITPNEYKNQSMEK